MPATVVPIAGVPAAVGTTNEIGTVPGAPGDAENTPEDGPAANTGTPAGTAVPGIATIVPGIPSVGAKCCGAAGTTVVAGLPVGEDDRPKNPPRRFLILSRLRTLRGVPETDAAMVEVVISIWIQAIFAASPERYQPGE